MTRTTPYAPCEALTSPMTAREWTEQFAPGSLQYAADADAIYVEITARAHCEAARLGLPHSVAGAYPPTVWELEFALNS